jgi:hypothetical protein
MVGTESVPDWEADPYTFEGFWTDSVWLGDRHQRSLDITRAGCKGIAAFPPGSYAPRGVALTELFEPCGALPRKCLLSDQENLVFVACPGLCASLSMPLIAPGLHTLNPDPANG